MAVVAIFYAIVIIYMIYSSMHSYYDSSQNETTTAVDADYEAQMKAIQAHIDGENRMRGDFVLTGAAFPFGENAVVPDEGFRVVDTNDEHDIFFVVAAVSAEKIWMLLHAFIELLGDHVQIAILKLDQEKDTSVDYIADEMDRYVLLNLLESYRDFVLNDGSIEISFFHVAGQSELRLDACKHFQFITRDLVSIVDVLHDFDVPSKKDIKFFPEGPYMAVSQAGNEKVFESFLNELTIVQTNYFDGKKTS